MEGNQPYKENIPPNLNALAQQLRKLTGAPWLECRRMLAMHDWDITRAYQMMLNEFREKNKDPFI